MKMYCVELVNYDEDNFIVGYATTEEKAKKMIDVMKATDGFEDYDYEYHWAYTDMLIINNEEVAI